MKKHFLTLALALTVAAPAALAVKTLPFEDPIASTPSYNSGEDSYYRYRDDGASTSTSWFFGYSSGTMQLRGSSAKIDGTLLWPQMDFEDGKCYYMELELVSNPYQVPVTISMNQYASELKTSQIGDSFASFTFTSGATGKAGSYFVADATTKRVGFNVKLESSYVSSFVKFDNYLVKEVDGHIPAAPTGLTATAATGGLKTADISFTAPSTDLLGNALSSLRCVRIYVDDALAAEVNAAPGQQVKYTVAASLARECTIKVAAVTDNGEGAAEGVSASIGGEMPADADFDYTGPAGTVQHKALAVYTPEAITLTWSPNSDAVSYQIMSMPSGQTVAQDITGTSWTDDTPMPADPCVRWYKVMSVGSAGEPALWASSNVVSVYNNVPMDIQIAASKEVMQLTQYNLAQDRSRYQTGLMNQKCLGVSASNHMVIFPGIKVEAGKHYRMDVYSMVYSTAVNMVATVGSSNTVEAQTIEVIPETIIKNSTTTSPNGDRFNGYFTAEADGTLFPAVRLYSDATTGAYSFLPRVSVVEVGEDLPGAIGEYSVTFDTDDPTKATVKFTAPTTNLNEGKLTTIDKIVVLCDKASFKELYDVKPGDECSFDVVVGPTEMHVYTIYAVNASGEGVNTDVPVFIINPPYTQDFKETKNLAGWTIINDDPMSPYTWHIQSNAARCYPDNGKLDDWMITPPLHLEGGKYYKTTFVAYGANVYYNTSVALNLGSDPTVEDLTEEVIPAYTVLGESRDEAALLKNYFTVPETGEYYLGFHGFSDANASELYVDDFTISAAIDGRVPGATTDLTILPDADGALNGRVQFTVPDKQINGEPLTNGPTAVKLYIDGVLFQDLGPNKPGQRLTVAVPVSAKGVHLFTLICDNDYGTGREAEDIAYFGINRPAAVTFVEAEETDEYGVVHITWGAPESDYDGFPINLKHVTYEVFTYYYDDVNGSTEQVVASGLTDTELTMRVQAASAKQDFLRFGVRAWTSFGGSPGFLAKYVSVGKPEVAPFTESFANYSPDMRFMSELQGDRTAAAWGYNSVLNIDGNVIEPSDDDKGMAIMEVMWSGGGSRLFSGKIDLSQLSHPGLTLQVYNNGRDDYAALNELAIEARTLKGDWVELSNATIVEHTADTYGWVKIQVDMAQFAGEVVQVAFNATARSHTFTVIDDLRIGEYAADNVVLLGIETPEAVAPGRPFAVTATTYNLGDNYVDDYIVELYRDGELIATRECGGLDVRAKGRARFTDTLNGTQGSTHTYRAVAVLAGDADNTDDAREGSLTLNASAFPGVENLVAVQSNSAEVTLSWEAPVLATEAETRLEDFEVYPPYANMNDDFEGWTMYDVDDLSINGLAVGGQEVFPPKVAAYTKQAWFVFDSTISDFIDLPLWATHSGGQCLLAMGCMLQGTSSDWLVSPVLSGEEQTISFWAHGYDSDRYTEKFNIYVNDDMEVTTPSSFTMIASQSGVPNEWTRYEYTLPAGTQHFAIEHCSAPGFMLFVDDITLQVGGDERLQPKGFNIYRDGQILAEASRMPLYVDTNVSDGDHDYHVGVAYNLGESRLAHASISSTGIAELGADAARVIGGQGEIIVTGTFKRVDIFNASGLHLYSLDNADRLPVAPGIYMVKVDGEVYKVTVK